MADNNTLAALKSDEGVQLAFVLAVEGYKNLLHTWHDNDAVTTAWAATDWAAAVGTLEIPPSMKQSIVPFRPKIEHDVVRFIIHDDANNSQTAADDDNFAQTVYKTADSTGNHTLLTANLSALGTTINVKDTSAFSGTPDLYIGTEKIDAATIATGTTFTCTQAKRGHLAPFHTDTQTNLGHAHNINASTAYGIDYRPRVTDYPQTWIGKWVGLYAHKVKGSTSPSASQLETRANAELVFAGRIADIEDGGNGTTVLSCTDVREVVESTVLFANQFRCKPEEKVYLEADIKCKFKAAKLVLGTLTYTTKTLTVGTDAELPAGSYTSQEIISALNDFILAHTETKNSTFWGADGGWTLTQHPTTKKLKISVRLDGITGLLNAELLCHHKIASALGFDPAGLEDRGGGMFRVFKQSESDANPEIEVWSPEVPFVTYVPEFESTLPREDKRLAVRDPLGTWVDQREFIPEPYKSDYTNSGESWGFILIADKLLALAKYNSDTLFDEVHVLDEFNRIFGAQKNEESGRYVLKEMDARKGIKQVLFLQERADVMIKKLILSTGEDAYNHATLDKYSYDLGAGIPWDLTGTAFTNSVDNMVADTNADMKLYLDKPMRLSEVLLPEMALRNAHLVFKAGKMVFAAPSVPGAVGAAHALTESNKAGDPNNIDANRSRYMKTRELLINSMKVEYDPDLKGGYRGVIPLSNEASRTNHGISKPVTIRLRNSFGEDNPLSGSLIHAIGELSGFAFTVFGKPLYVITRSINYSLFHMTPGDTCTISDSYIRDPTTGTRGIIGKPGWVLSVDRDWRTGTGQVRIVITDEDSSRRTVYSPAGELDETTVTGSLDIERDNTEYGTVTDSASLDITDDITCEWWMKLESFTGVAHAAVSKYSGAQLSYKFQLETSNKIGIYVTQNGATIRSATTSYTPSVGTWTHYAISLDVGANVVEFYVNGSPQATGALNLGGVLSIHSGSSNVFIGANDASPVEDMDGMIADVRLWSTVRSASDIADNYNTALTGSESNLVMNLPLISDGLDLTSNNNDMSLTGSPSYTTDGPYGSSAGYDAATPAITLKANAYSDSSESADITHFEANDLIRITEISPADPTAPVTWDRTVVSTDNSTNSIVLNSALTSPSFDSSLLYRVTSQIYSSAQTSQKADCYMGDDTDGSVLDTVQNYFWTTQPFESALTTITPSDARRHEFPRDDNEWETDGYPVHPGLHRQGIDCVNNLLSRRCAVQTPMMMKTAITTSSTSYVLAQVAPVYWGVGQYGMVTRKVQIRPRIKVTSGATMSIRVTLSLTPPNSDSGTTTPNFITPYKQVEFTSSSASEKVLGQSTLQLMAHASRGTGFITVEIKTTLGTVTYYGLSKLAAGTLS